MIRDDLIERVISEFSNYDARLLLLTAEGLKSGSEIRFSKTKEELEKHLDIMDALELNYHNFLRKHIYDNKMSHQLFFWKDWPRVDPKKAYKAYRTGGHRLAGRFFGYPDCCTIHKKGTSVRSKYIYELQEIYQTEGIEGIEHLVGIFHEPCNANCQGTKDLGFAKLLKERAPELYMDELKILVNRVSRYF